MGQFSTEIYIPPGSTLSGNQQNEHRPYWQAAMATGGVLELSVASSVI